MASRHANAIKNDVAVPNTVFKVLPNRNLLSSSLIFASTATIYSIPRFFAQPC